MKGDFCIIFFTFIFYGELFRENKIGTMRVSIMLNSIPQIDFLPLAPPRYKMNIKYLLVTCLLHAQIRGMTAGFVSCNCGCIGLHSMKKGSCQFLAKDCAQY